MKNLNAIKNQIEINIILFGSSSDGKTKIIERYIDNTYKQIYLSTLGIDIKFKKVKMEDDSEVRVKVTDTAGQERYKSIASNYLKKADGIIIAYDITDNQSFNIAEYEWINQIKNDSSLKEKVIFLVGNKSDLEDQRVISKEEGEELSKKYGVMFSECSAKTGENVNFIFNELIKKCYQLAKERREEKIKEKEKNKTEKEKKEEKKRREIQENKRREIEEKERWKIEEEKAKKNFKILDKYISF